MSQLLESLTALARQWAASDIFIAEGHPARLKVNGAFHQHEQQVSTADMHELCAACSVAPDLVQDRDAAWYAGDGTRFRVNLHRRMGRLGAVLRQIRTQVPTMESLGLPSDLLQEWLTRRAGLILVTGPTGCGKSTTVASCLDHLSNNRPGHIVTIEDPIEYLFSDRLAFFTQREVGLDTPNYLTGLQKALRQAPVHQPLHLGQPLQRRGPRLRHRARIAGAGDVAVRQPGIVVHRADQPVEVDLDRHNAR